MTKIEYIEYIDDCLEVGTSADIILADIRAFLVVDILKPYKKSFRSAATQNESINLDKEIINDYAQKVTR